MSIIKLNDICFSVSKSKKANLPQKVINTSNILHGKITPILEFNKVLGQFKKTAKLNDILFSEIRPGNGRWALVQEDISSSLISTKILVIRSKNEIILSKYLYFLLTLKLNFQIVSIAKSRSGTFPQITFSEISKIKTYIPSLKEQKFIIGIIERNEKLFLKYV